METGYECTHYFRGGDGLGTCDTDCQWWVGSCPAAKGSKEWDGREHYSMAHQVQKPKEQ